MLKLILEIFSISTYSGKSIMKTEYKIGNEKGIAILLTLGFLALLSILAMLFIATAVTNRKIARNYNDLTTAKMLAQSTINRAIASMKLYSDDVTKDFSDINSKSAYSYDSIEAREDLVSLLPTVKDEVKYYSKNDYTGTDKPTWQYFPSNTSTDTPIVGRVAFIAIADNGKIMPSAAVSNLDENAPQERPGADISEIWLGSLKWINGNGKLKRFFNNSKLKESRSEIYIDGKMPINGWGSSDLFFSRIPFSNSTKKAELLQCLSFGNPPDLEAFWIDANSNDVKTADELFHRFNLQRTDWDSFTVDSIANTNNVLHNSTDSGNIAETIPWLKNWKSAGDMGSVEACKNQIIANLIDYNDTDSSATTDDENDPTYVGLEKCPYISDVKFEIRVDQVNSGPTPYPSPFRISTIVVEIVNMYDEEFDTTATVSFSGKYTRFTDDIEENFSGSFDLNISIGPKKYESKLLGYSFGSLKTFQENQNVKDLTITDLTVKLVGSVSGATSTDSDFYDFAKIADSSTQVINLPVTGDNSPQLWYEIPDPRQNLLPSDWGGWIIKPQPWSDHTKFNGDNLFPSNVKHSVAKDFERHTSLGDPKPWEISTAFIRNGPMKSPWELGAIHRGKKWQTINLKRYNETEGMSGGGDDYQDGDANILDQIKMGDSTETLGKIDINTRQNEVLNALFYGIYLESGYDNPGLQSASQPMIDFTEALTLSTSIRGVSLSNNIKTRAQILGHLNGVTKFWELWDNELFLSPLSPPDPITDAMQEEIIGKFINLTKAGSINSIAIIAVAQTIDDVGGDVTVSKDINQDGDIDDANEIIEHAQYGTYDQFADEITSTQKVFVVIYRNPTTNEFRVGRFEYLDK